MKYSPDFRSSVVRKTLDRSGKSVSEISPGRRESRTGRLPTAKNCKEKYRLGPLNVWGASGLTPAQRNPPKKIDASAGKQDPG